MEKKKDIPVHELIDLSNRVFGKEDLEKVKESPDPLLQSLEVTGKQFLAFHRFLEEENFTFSEPVSNVQLFLATMALRFAAALSRSKDISSLADTGTLALKIVAIEEKKNVSQAAN